MPRSLLPFGLTLLVAGLAGVACGESSGDTGSSPNAGQGSGGETGGSGAAAAGKGGLAAGGSGTAGASAGKPSGGTSGGPGGNEGGSETSGEAGAQSSGGDGGLSSCDPKKVLCKSLPQECPAGEVPSVEGICWGPCVKIAECACAGAADCPEPEQFTCWAKQHCGPYVE